MTDSNPTPPGAYPGQQPNPDQVGRQGENGNPPTGNQPPTGNYPPTGSYPPVGSYPPPESGTYAYATPGTPSQPPKKKHTGLIVTLVIVALLLCTCCGVASCAAATAILSDDYYDDYYYDDYYNDYDYYSDSDDYYTTPLDSQGFLPAGQYTVGVDLDPGEYLLTGEGLAVIYSDGDVNEARSWNYENHDFVTLEQGDSVLFSGDSLYYADDAALYLDLSSLGEGTFRVGIDIAAGDYTVTPDGDGDGAQVTIASDSTHQDTSIVSRKAVAATETLTLVDGQYVTFEHVEVAALTDNISAEGTIAGLATT